MNRIKEAREAASRQGSNSSSSFSYKTKSIQELKARGYYELPQRKARPILEEPMSTEVDEESEDECFWRKPSQDVEPKSPVCYDKQSYMKFDSFSMMFHKNKSASKDISDTEFVQENFGGIIA